MNEIESNINKTFIKKREILYQELNELTKKKQIKYINEANIILKFVEYVIESMQQPYYRPQDIKVNGDISSFYSNSNATSIATLTTRGLYVGINFTAKNSCGMKSIFTSLDAEETINSILKENGIDIELNEDKDKDENIVNSNISIAYHPILVNDLPKTKNF